MSNVIKPLAIAAVLAAIATVSLASSASEKCLGEFRAIGDEGIVARERMEAQVAIARDNSQEIHSRLDELAILRDLYKELSKSYEKIEKKVKDVDDATLKELGFRGTIRKSIEACYNTETNLLAHYRKYVVADGGNKKLKSNIDSAEREFNNALDLWKRNLERAQAHYYKCRRSDCERYYRETYDAKRPSIENNIELMKEYRSNAQNDYLSISEIVNDVEEKMVTCREKPENIGKWFGYDAVTDVASLISELDKKQLRYIVDGKIWGQVKSYESNEAVPMPESKPTTLGKVFSHWSKEGEKGEFTGFGKALATDTRLEAKWAYKVAPEGQVGRLIREDVGVIMQEDLDAFGTPSKEGSTFEGWEDVETGNLVDVGHIVSKHITLKPRFRDLRYTITFYHEGNNIGRKVYGPNERVEKRRLECEKCKRWSLTAYGGEEWDGFDKPLTSDVKLYAIHSDSIIPSNANQIIPSPVRDHNIIIVDEDGVEVDRLGVADGSVLPVSWIKSKVPSRKGYVWMGFDKELDANLAVERDLTYQVIMRKKVLNDYIEEMRGKIPFWLLILLDIVLIGLIFPVSRIGRAREAE